MRYYITNMQTFKVWQATPAEARLYAGFAERFKMRYMVTDDLNSDTVLRPSDIK